MAPGCAGKDEEGSQLLSSIVLKPAKSGSSLGVGRWEFFASKKCILGIV